LVLYGTEDNPLNTFTPTPPLDGTTHKPSADISYSVADSGFSKHSDKAGKSTLESPSVIPKSPPYICHEECSKGCTGPTPEECTDCRNFVLNNTCVKLCPFGTYGSLPRAVAGSENQSNSVRRLCLACEPVCVGCYGPGPEHCLGCDQDRFLLPGKGQCVKTCPTGYHTDTTQRLCTTCGSNTTCTSCPAHLVLSAGLCEAQCGEGEYDEQGVCRVCHQSCLTCVGGRDTQCGRCKEGFYFERRCVRYCPAGYASDHSRGECLPCPTGCDQCQGDGGECTKCRQGWIRTPESLCLPPESSACQPGMYPGQGTCLACHDSCETCVGPTHKDCSSCYPDHKLHISVCVAVCPPSTVLSSSGHSCLACPHACAGCSTGGHCTSCIHGY
jgi:proprotein convertase subtilisin/kexin type 5